MSTVNTNRQSSGQNNHVKNIAIVGAGGRSGSHMVKALLAKGNHTITALTRADSSNKLPEGVIVKTIDYEKQETMVEALQGQDALIITMSVMAPPEYSTNLITAAAKAKVPFIVPNEWGLDQNNPQLGHDTLLGKPVQKNRELIKELGQSSYIGVACSFWYEYSLTFADWTYGFDFKNRKVTFYDDGETKVNTSTFPQVGRAVANLLSLKINPDDENDKSPTLSTFRNRSVYITSFLVSQKDMFESVLRATGTKREDWTINYEGSKARFERGHELLKTGDRIGFGTLLYARVFYPDGSGNFEETVGLNNDILELPKENLDEVTKSAIDDMNAGTPV